MILALFALGVALLTAAVVWAALRGEFTAVKTVDGVLRELRRVDLPAMQNLIDPAQDEFLHSRLKPADFRRVQRARKLATIEYVAAIARNAALLIRLGEMARANDDPLLKGSAEAIINTAVSVRLHAVAALCKLTVTVAFPSASLSTGVPIDAYEKLRAVLLTSGTPQARSVVSRAAAAL